MGTLSALYCSKHNEININDRYGKKVNIIHVSFVTSHKKFEYVRSYGLKMSDAHFKLRYAFYLGLHISVKCSEHTFHRQNKGLPKIYRIDFFLLTLIVRGTFSNPD